MTIEDRINNLSLSIRRRARLRALDEDDLRHDVVLEMMTDKSSQSDEQLLDRVARRLSRDRSRMPSDHYSLSNLPGHSQTPESLVAEAEEVARVRRYMEYLSPADRCLLLASHGQIHKLAKNLGMKPDRARKRKQRLIESTRISALSIPLVSLKGTGKQGIA